MVNIINFPNIKPGEAGNKSNVSMVLTRNIKGLTVSINLAKLTKEELLQALLPLPSENKGNCEKIDLVNKYINQ